MTKHHRIGLDLNADGTGLVKLDGRALSGVQSVQVMSDEANGTIAVIALQAHVTGSVEADFSVAEDEPEKPGTWIKHVSSSGTLWLNPATGEQRTTPPPGHSDNE